MSDQVHRLQALPPGFFDDLQEEDFELSQEFVQDPRVGDLLRGLVDDDFQLSQGMDPAPALVQLKAGEEPLFWLEEHVDLKALGAALLRIPQSHKDRRKVAMIARGASPDGKYQVPYFFSKKKDFGRAFARGPSLQRLAKLIKNAAVAAGIKDFDIVRAPAHRQTDGQTDGQDRETERERERVQCVELLCGRTMRTPPSCSFSSRNTTLHVLHWLSTASSVMPCSPRFARSLALIGTWPKSAV